jgi:regulator of nucleoside diphosphate kinase
MEAKKLYITDDDLRCINQLLDSAAPCHSKDSGHLEMLRAEVRRARVVPSSKIDPDVVTMNSRVLIKDMDTREEFSFEVVFPCDADPDAGKISVLAPVGTAILGYKVGDTVAHEVPGGKRKLAIKKMLYQPCAG